MPEATLRDITPGFDRAAVELRVGEGWEVLDGRFPLPRFRQRCPICRGEEIQLSGIVYGRHPGTIPGRADVRFKCCTCSLTWTFGVPVPDDVLTRLSGKLSWDWREIEEATSGVDQDG